MIIQNGDRLDEIMTFLQIQYFLEVCKTMNFTKAAQNLFVSQSSFSRQIQLLETEIGVQLMVRNNREVILTEAGDIFRNEFDKIMLDIEGAIHRVQKADKPKKEIRVGLFYGLIPKDIYPFIQKLKICFEDYKVYVDKYSTDNLKKAYALGEADIIIGIEEIGIDDPDSDFCEIQRVPAYVVYAKELFDDPGMPRSLEDFQHLKLFCSKDPEAQALAKKQLQIAERLGLEPTECSKVDNVVSTLLFVETRSGYSIYVNSPAREGLKIYEIPGEQESFSVMAYWKRNNALGLDSFFSQCVH